MANIIIKTPTQAFLSNYDKTLNPIKKALTYKNTSQQFLLSKHLKNKWLKNKNPEYWEAHKQALQDGISTTLVFEENGAYYIRPGSIPYLQKMGYIGNITNEITYPKPKPTKLAKDFKYNLYPYQEESVRKLISVKHGNVSIATGGGKTLAILKIAQELGLNTVIATPSVSIFQEILKQAQYHFGASKVGAFGDGKKQLGKQITVCIGKSLSMIKPDSKEEAFFKNTQVILIDESHQFASDTLEKVCHGVVKNAPYRFFFSGTQTRGDGTVQLLESIIGQTVFTLTTADAVKGGYISDHEFKIVQIKSPSRNVKYDPLDIKREHFLRNKNIAEKIAKTAELLWNLKKQNSLILVDEVGQIEIFKQYCNISFLEATGDKDNSSTVEAFNRGECPILIGTSCISTGTNIFCHHTFNWQGGSSEVKTKQGAVGRAIRKITGSEFESFHVKKDKAIIWDFDVLDVPSKKPEELDTLKRHLIQRIKYYQDSERPISVVKLSG